MTVAGYEIVRKQKKMEVYLRHILKGAPRSVDSEAMKNKRSFFHQCEVM